MKRIGIIGEGKMGTNIFYYLTHYGYDLTWIVSRDASVQAMENTFQKKIRRSMESGLIEEDHHDHLFSYTTISQDLSKLGDCDLVIEAVSENLLLKQVIFSQMEQVTSPHCILATNSSSILPSEISSSDDRRDKTIGLHFFYPVSLKNIVEFVRLPETSATTIKKVSSFLEKISRSFVILFPENAFLLNRLFLDLQTEAFSIVSEKSATIEQIDRFIQMYITPAGVFEFCDHVGNDIMFTSIMNYIRNEKDQQKYLPVILELDKMVQGGRLGKKTGIGFYKYEKNQQVQEKPSGELNHVLVRRLRHALESSITRFATQTGLGEEKIHELLKEYF